MSLSVKMGSFTLPNTTNTSFAVTGVGFLPKLVLFMSAFNYSWANATNDSHAMQFGAASGVGEEFSHSIHYLDNLLPSLAPGRQHFAPNNNATKCVAIPGWFNVGGTHIWAERIGAALASFDSDGFTLNVTCDTSFTSSARLPFPTDSVVQYIAFGGSDLEAYVGVFQPGPSSPSGYKTVSGVGFRPKAVFILGNEGTSKQIESPFNLGAALDGSPTSSLQCTLYASDSGSNTSGITSARLGKFYESTNEGSDQRIDIEFVQMTNDGFTMNEVVALDTANVGFVAFGGNAQYDIGRWAGATAVGDQDVSAAVKPKALILFGDNKAAHTDLSFQYTPTFGFAVPNSASPSPLTDAVIGGYLVQSVNPSDVVIRKDNTKSLLTIDGNTATVLARGRVTQANSPTGFRVNWDTADATARIFNYFAIAAAAPQELYPNEDISAGGWRPSVGSPNLLYPMIDESPVDDGDFDYTTSLSTMEVKLEAGVDPVASDGHTVYYRLKGDGTTDAVVKLKQGTTVIATWTETNVPSTLTDYEHTLSEGEADSITDYSNLRISVEAA